MIFGILRWRSSWEPGQVSTPLAGPLSVAITSTLLTLIVVPVVYTYLVDLSQSWVIGGVIVPVDANSKRARASE
jgi:hypothetical protein